MLLSFPDAQSFATGAVRYFYRPIAGYDQSPRIIAPVEIERITTYAVVDTGAPYVICAPEVAQVIGLKPAAALSKQRMLVRGVVMKGRLYRLTLRLLADRGESLSVDATAFILDPEFEASWGKLPSFIGLSGCLERLRFAVDPAADTFYFGPLE
jgi:hypothetical protein